MRPALMFFFHVTTQYDTVRSDYLRVSSEPVKSCHVASLVDDGAAATLACDGAGHWTPRSAVVSHQSRWRSDDRQTDGQTDTR